MSVQKTPFLIVQNAAAKHYATDKHYAADKQFVYKRQDGDLEVWAENAERAASVMRAHGFTVDIAKLVCMS